MMGVICLVAYLFFRLRDTMYNGLCSKILMFVAFLVEICS